MFKFLSEEQNFIRFLRQEEKKLRRDQFDWNDSMQSHTHILM